MDNSILIALIGSAGSIIGSFCGYLAGQKLIAYRIEQLEKKVDKHNHVVERMYNLEGRMNEAEHDIRDMKKGK